MENEKKTYELLVEGRNKAIPTELVISRSSAGHEQVVVQFKFTQGDGESAKNVGKHITWWGNTEGAGVKYTIAALETLGWDSQQDLYTFKPTKEVELVIEHDTMPAKGDKPARKVDRVKYINALDGAGGGRGLEKIKLAPAEAQAASTSIMARFRAFKTGSIDGGTTPNGATPNAFESNAKDDLPF